MIRLSKFIKDVLNDITFSKTYLELAESLEYYSKKAKENYIKGLEKRRIHYPRRYDGKNYLRMLKRL